MNSKAIGRRREIPTAHRYLEFQRVRIGREGDTGAIERRGDRKQGVLNSKLKRKKKNKNKKKRKN